MGKKRLQYDDEALVEMISEGQMTYKAIGQELGISEILVKQIAQGRRRKELGQRLWDAENGIVAEARRIALQYARHMVMEQIRLGLRGEGEPARRAREFVLKFAVSSRPQRKDLPGQKDRSPEWMLQMSREMGIVPWEDELDAEREREAMEEEARNGEGLTAESAEGAEGEEAGKKATGNRQQATGMGGKGLTAEDAEGAEGEEAGSRELGTRNRERGTGKGRAVVTAASMPASGVLAGSAGPTGPEAASMPATGVLPGPAVAAGPEAASMPAMGVGCDG
ncbi:MAG: hypothetical protein NTV86_14110 [Planctomycetota bacterium]|nr:hypothetical protein [Planctomycetota bacterium]